MIDDKPHREAARKVEAAGRPEPAETAFPHQAATAAADGGSAMDRLIDEWWAEHFHGSEVARVTEAWNCAYRAKEELKRRLKGFH